MNELRVSDAILMSVEKPARYIGNELNAVSKPWESVPVHFALCFPDIYEIGMSHLGLSILYTMMNKRPDTLCERVFSPWIDMEKVMRAEGVPLYSLESQKDVLNFDFLGFTVQYEMSYTNILNAIDLSGMAIYAKDRLETDPIVCAGGPCTYNPEPIAPFIDFFYIGEAETTFHQVLDLYAAFKAEGKTKSAFLEAILDIEGIYVPKFYDVAYNEDGTLQSFTPNHPNAKPQIQKQLVVDMTQAPFPEEPIIPFIQPVHDRVVLELFRGCSRGCRFCQAGMVYRPVRDKDVETLKKQADILVENTGQDEISLISLSSSDYPHLHELSNYLVDTCGQEHVNLSLPSLRIDAFSLELMSKVQDVKKSSLTFAPEAGSQRMRDVINKGLTEEVILKGAYEAFQGGWNRVKLYFMLGLPTETQEDVLAIAALGQDIVTKYYTLPKDQRSSPVQVIVSASFFVPKPFTPFQWVAQDSADAYIEKQRLLNRNINKKNIKFNSHDAKTSVLEGVFARGDRRVSEVLVAAFKKGASFDSWSECFRNSAWVEAFEETGIDPAFYAQRVRDKDELLPWDFIDIGVSKDFLYREYERSVEAKTTINCMEGCANCGAKVFNGGICYED